MDIRYATGFVAPDPVIVFLNGRNKHLAVPAMEAARARRTARDWHVWTWEDLKSKSRCAYRLSELAFALLRRAKARRVVVPADFPVAVADALRTAGIRVTVREGRLFPKRAVKTAMELKWIRHAQKAAAAGLERALEVLKISRCAADETLIWRGEALTSERLRAEIHQVLLAHNCEGFETIAACGPASADPHERGHGRIKARQPIVLDIFPRELNHGYWGDLTRTVVKGAPPAVLQGMYDAVKKAHSAAISAVRSKVECKTVHNAACRVFEQFGFKTDISAKRPRGFIHSTGHGVGLEVHEPPSVSLRPGRLCAGNVITIEPGLYEPAIGGVRIEDTIEVTMRGMRFIWPVREVFGI